MSKVLVTYFSAGGTTAKVGIKLAKAIEADVYQILPKVPYRAGDLNWMNKKSRSSVEMSDRNCRPEMANKLSNMEDYDVIFLGFPNWYRTYPRIIATFIRDHNFFGKVLIPFCTNEEGALGFAESELKSSAKGAIIKAGFACRGYEAEKADKDLKEWLERVL